jgi:hypothetical protein
MLLTLAIIYILSVIICAPLLVMTNRTAQIKMDVPHHPNDKWIACVALIPIINTVMAVIMIGVAFYMVRSFRQEK